MANFQIGQPGVTAFLQSLLRNLDVVMEMDDFIHVQSEMELKEMKKLLHGFECVLLDGERKRQHGVKDVERWMDDLKDLFYDIDDLLDEVKMEKQQLQPEITGEPSDGKVRYNHQDGFFTQKNIKSMLEEVLDKLRERTEEANGLQLKRDAVQHDSIWLESQAKVRQKPGCYADEPAIHGREEDKKRIIEMLLADDGGEIRRRNYEFVCVVGMGGLGKTTLAQLVFQEESVKRSFAVRSWACVSDVFDVIKVAQSLIESAEVNAGKHDGSANMPAGLSALQTRLEEIFRGQKFLLVLDDVWMSNVFEDLKGPLNIGAKGSKILVTTRLSKVAEDLRNKEPYQLEPLEYAQCLKIFNDNAFGEEDGIDDDKGLMKIGEEIVRKCKGVPLVAKVIGAVLRGKEEGEWKQLKDDGIWDLAYKFGDLHPGLRLSYFYLPPYLKRCFEYFALFPTDFKFDEREVVRMWMAEGLIEVEEGREPEEIGKQYYNDLKGRNLIQEDDMIHDMVHHLACIVSGSFFFRGLSGSSSSISTPKCARHAFSHKGLIVSNKLRTLIHKGELGQELFSYKRCRVLEVVCKSRSHLPSTLGCDLKHLRYLKLTGKFWNGTLPDSICTLTNLQVLDISNCRNLKNLPQDVGKLLNLKFLELKCSGITVLPDSLCALTNLKELDLSSCRDLNNLPEDVGKLLNLRFLRLLHSGITVLPNSICTLTNLKELDLSSCRDLKNLPEDLGKLSNLRFLGLHDPRIILLPDSVCSLLNLQVLDLPYCERLTTLPKHMGNLQSLHKLFLRESSRSSLPESIVDATNLGELQSFNLHGIREPVTLPAHIGKLTKLEGIRKFCVGKEKGRGIDELKGMNRLGGSLTIENMENIESPEEALLANLRSKKRIEELKFVWKEYDTALTGRDGEMESVRVMEALEPNVAIKSLSFENYVGRKFPSWMSTAPLLNLTHLYLFNLPLMAELTGMEFKSLLFLDLDSCAALREVSMATPKLETLLVRDCNQLIALKLSPYLEALHIQNCPNLRNFPYGLHYLTSLRKIEFWHCPSLEIHPHDPLPPSITAKSIRNCPKLDVQRVMEKEEEWKGAFGLI